MQSSGTPQPSSEAVRVELESLLVGEDFRRAPRLAELLRYVVDEALAGRADRLGEYSIALDVFGRPESFDTATDTIVRSHTRRLRRRLGEHYGRGLGNGGVRIELPKGGYAPRFLVAARPNGHESAGAAPAHGDRKRSRPWRIGALAAGGAIAVITVVWALTMPRQPRNAYRMVPLSTWEGPEFSTGWSPDGRFIALNRWFNHSYDLFVMRVEGRVLTRVTDSAADEFCGRWSPDGRWLAYLSNEGGDEQVWLTSPEGQAKRLIASTNVHHSDRFDDSYLLLGNDPWSPDGKELLFSRLGQGGSIAVWKTNLDSSAETPVTFPAEGQDDLQGGWSRNGRLLVFVRRDGAEYQLWLSEGGEERPLLADGFNHTHPVWMPDNRRVVFESNRAGPVNLWELDLPTGRVSQLTLGPGMDRRPIVSPASELAYTSHRQRMGVYVRDLESGLERRLSADTQRMYQPRFSPTGDRILYQSNRRGAFDLWIQDLATGRERNLTSSPANDQAGDWSPDGRHVVFVSNRNGKPMLWTQSVDGGPPSLLTDRIGLSRERGRGVFVSPKWSPDGTAIGCVAPANKGLALWVLHVKTREVKPVLFNVEDFDWYRDSHRVIYTPAAQGDHGTELRVVNLKTGEDRLLLESAGSELSVAGGGSAVTYLSGPTHNERSLWRLPLKSAEDTAGLPEADGPPERLTDGKGIWHAHNGGLSWDGGSIAYVRDEVQADIYLLGGYR